MQYQKNIIKSKDIINDNISVLCFFLKNYYANIVTADREHIKTHILALIDKYYHPDQKDITYICEILIQYNDDEIFKIIFKKFNRFIDKKNIFYLTLKYNSFKILNYYLDNTTQPFWKLYYK